MTDLHIQRAKLQLLNDIRKKNKEYYSFFVKKSRFSIPKE